jgi:pimeloyl-ACP methyl ester carboxylesterase
MEKQFLYQSSEIFYRTEGEGIPLVLLHGFAEDGTVWKNQVEFLKQQCKLIIPDLPGSGRSQMLSFKEDIMIDDYADCIYALLKQENITECIVLGHSMGGYITLAFVEKYPYVLSGFGFVHSTAFADSEEKKKNRQRGIEMIEQYGVYPFVKNTTPNLFAGKFKNEHADEIEALIEQAKDFTKQVLQQYYRAMMLRPDRTNILRSSEVPVLFIIGTEDVAAPMTDVLKQVHMPSVSYIHIIENTGHMSMWEASYELNGYILTFIKDIKRSA